MKAKSIRKALSLVATVGISLSLVGCSGANTVSTKDSTQKSGNTNSTTTAKSTATFSNKVIQVQYPQMTGLDTTVWAGQILVNQGTTFEGLYGYDQNNKIVPKIATGYTVSKDGLTYTIKLRKDAKWSNGDPVTANDFYYAWMRIISPQDSQGAIWASVMQFVKNGWAYHGGAAKASDVGLKVLDDYTLQITLQKPHNIIPYLVLSSAMPLNQKATEAHPNDWWMPKNFVTDGPYKVKSFVQNGKVELVKNPNYVPAPGQSVGNFKEIDLIPNTTVPVEAFMSGKIDVVQISSPSDLKYVNDHPELKAQLQEQSDNSVNYLQWDKSAQKSPLDNPKVRQAIAMAIDKKPIAENVLSNLVTPTDVFGTPDWPAAKLEKGLSYNAAQAKKLLAEAGYPNGKGLPTFNLYTQTKTDNPNSVSIAMALAQELKQNLGVNFKIIPEASTQYGGIVWGGQNKDVKPGYCVATGVANWNDPSSTPLQADQAILFAGTYGASPAIRQHMYPWYTTPYSTESVQKYGDPNDSKMGTHPGDMDALSKAAKADIAWMNNWIAKQPEPYRSEIKPDPSYQQQWDTLYSTWKNAKDNATKHEDWVNAWKFIGNYSTGVGNATLGLDGTIYWDKTQSQQVHDWRMWDTELENATDQNVTNKITGKLVTQLMQQGYVIPLFYQKTVFLERAGVTGAQANPWSWGNFYQFQYLKANTK